MTGKTAKNPRKQFVDQNPVEAFRSIGGGVAQSFASDLGKGAVADLWDQLLGGEEFKEKSPKRTTGDLFEGEELDLKRFAKNRQNEKMPLPSVKPGVEYSREVLFGERVVNQQETQVVKVKIQEIIVELKRLTASSKILQSEFREITTEQRVAKPGKYHLSFFEWILSTVRSARLKIEDSGAWLATFYRKKAKRQYWAMFKKHGTTFGLSSERVVSTQTG